LQVLCEHANVVRMVLESYRARRITSKQSAESVFLRNRIIEINIVFVHNQLPKPPPPPPSRRHKQNLSYNATGEALHGVHTLGRNSSHPITAHLSGEVTRAGETFLVTFVPIAHACNPESPPSQHRRPTKPPDYFLRVSPGMNWYQPMCATCKATGVVTGQVSSSVSQRGRVSPAGLWRSTPT
jgi:hypothetical protein